MRPVLAYLYLLVLTFWVGGMAIFTFIVTPAIFRSYNRDLAGEIVGKLFPVYFPSLFALSLLALLLFLLLRSDASAVVARTCLALLLAAVLVNSYVTFKLYPDAVRIKQQVATFDRATPDTPARQEFRRLHAVSAVLNLFVLLDGATLLALSRHLGRNASPPFSPRNV
jgi:uncharacterized membrane protein